MRPGARHRRHAGAARGQHRQPASRRRERRRRRPRLARPAVHRSRGARHRPPVRPDPGAQGLALRSRADHQGERQPHRHRRPSQPHARRPRRRRGRAGPRAADRLGAADPHDDRAALGRSGLRHDWRPDHAHVADRPALPEVAGRRGRRARRDPEAEGDPRRRDGDGDVLRPARRRLRPAVHRRRPGAERRISASTAAAAGRTHVVRVLRGVQDPGQEGPRLQRTRHQVDDAGGGRQRGAGARGVQERRPDRQAPDHRPRRDARVRRRARARDHRRRRRRARQRPQPEPRAEDVHPAAASARSRSTPSTCESRRWPGWSGPRSRRSR